MSNSRLCQRNTSKLLLLCYSWYDCVLLTCTLFSSLEQHRSTWTPQTRPSGLAWIGVRAQRLYVTCTDLFLGTTYATRLRPDQRWTTLRHMLATLRDPKLTTYLALWSVASEHELSRGDRNTLIAALETHYCTWGCMVHTADAAAAGVIPPSSSYTPIVRSPQPRNPKPTERRQRNRNPEVDSPARSMRRKAQDHQSTADEEAERVWWAENWPQVESTDSLKQVGSCSSRVVSNTLTLLIDHSRASVSNNRRGVGPYPLLFLQSFRACIRRQGSHHWRTRHIAPRLGHILTA